ncbi:MAG: LEA type 2 family protein [Bacteroidetes bacterium]|nr:LEA type 2 family protein [Bacteroidota bacterium]MBS1670161.1 LEA type 2 family protein [Bacteroidota bacterium]
MKKITSLLLAVLIFWGCKKPQGFEYRDMKNVSVKQFGFNKTQLAMDLIYFNPNNFGVDLKHVDCDVYIDNNYLGKFLLDTTMHIDRKSEFSLPSKIDVDMKNVFKNTLNVLFNKEVLVTVKGTTKVGKAGIYINVPFNYEARHKIDLL